MIQYTETTNIPYSRNHVGNKLLIVLLPINGAHKPSVVKDEVINLSTINLGAEVDTDWQTE